MKNKHTFLFTISFVLLTSFGFAQQVAIDTLKAKPKTLNLRVGVNVLKPIISAFDENIKGIGLVADVNVYKRFYAALEIGKEEKTSEEEYINFTTDGTYAKIGFNYNAYNNWPGMNNDIYVGMRYGISLFNHTLNSYTPNIYGNYFTITENTTNIDYNDLNLHWVELVFELNVETFKNLYLGASMSFNKVISAKEPTNFKNLYAPGFGRIYENQTGFGLNYTVSYKIPLFKKNK